MKYLKWGVYDWDKHNKFLNVNLEHEKNIMLYCIDLADQGDQGWQIYFSINNCYKITNYSIAASIRNDDLTELFDDIIKHKDLYSIESAKLTIENALNKASFIIINDKQANFI